MQLHVCLFPLTCELLIARERQSVARRREPQLHPAKGGKNDPRHAEVFCEAGYWQRNGSAADGAYRMDWQQHAIFCPIIFSPRPVLASSVWLRLSCRMAGSRSLAVLPNPFSCRSARLPMLPAGLPDFAMHAAWLAGQRYRPWTG